MRLLVTGGTGTIGTAVVKMALKGIKALDPEEHREWEKIIIFSRDEYKQALMEQSLKDVEGVEKLRFYLGDVRDLKRLEMAMEDVTHVVHTAALKRIEKCESDPIEAIRTNIEGTANVIHAALRVAPPYKGHGHRHVCAVSTDKAVNPTSLYGATKLTMERLVLAANNLSGGKCTFSVVRQGNIFGSRGSVVEIWQKLIDSGCTTLPITDAFATRYFVTAENAARFIMSDLLNPEPGIKMPLDLKAYVLGDLFQAIGGCEAETKDFNPYEKRHEQMTDTIDSSMADRLSISDLIKELEALKKR